MELVSLSHWLKTAETVEYLYKHRSSYVAYFTNEQELLLARVVDFMNSGKYKIRTGIGRIDIVPGSETFYKLRFPIDKTFLRWYWTNYKHDPDGCGLTASEIDQKMSKWIITDAMFEKIGSLCFKGLLYAKTGNWDAFVSEIKPVIGESQQLPESPKACQFFEKWSFLEQAIAHEQNEFVLKYYNKHKNYIQRTGIHSTKSRILDTATIYGNLSIFKTLNETFQCSSHVAHLAIIHEKYEMLQWFVSKYQVQDMRRALLNVDKTTNCNIVGTCIMRNDLKALKIIYELRSKTDTFKSRFAADAIVFAGNTAIQAAFMLSGGHFEMLEYLLSKHNPRFDVTNILDVLDADDPNLQYLVQQRDAGYYIWVNGERRMAKRTIKTRQRLKVSLTRKPDTEGFTIDERISKCKLLEFITNEQASKLTQILASRRRHQIVGQRHRYYSFW